MPHPSWLIPLGILIPITLLTPFLGFLRGILFAVFVVLSHASLYQQQIDVLFDGSQDTTITGQIDSFFKPLTHGYQSSFVVNQLNNRPLPIYYKPRLQILWPNGEILSNQGELPQLGERWRLDVTLKPVLGRLNIAGFDKEKHYLTQGWHANAVVKSAQRVDNRASLRAKLHAQLIRQSEDLDSHAYLLALTFGDRRGLSSDDWEHLKNSGLVHLMAISGLHIGLAFAVGYWLGIAVNMLLMLPIYPNLKYRRFGLHFLPWLPWCIGVAFAFGYAWLAGFSLPTQRALFMCSILVFFHSVGLYFNAWKVILICLSSLLILDPFAVMSSGFWMSFCAVAVIYLFIGIHKFRGGWRGRIKQLFCFQFWILVGMLPISIYLFQGFSGLAPFYNLLFVPMVGVLVMPLIAVGLFCMPYFPLVAQMIWTGVDIALWPIVHSMTYASDAWLNIGSQWTALSVLPLLLVSCYLIFNRMQLMVVCAVFMLTLWPYRSREGWYLHVLDVGHGLAVLIERQGEAVLYDTGLAWPGGSYVQSVVQPVLKTLAIHELDGLILSHLDNDHAGGRDYAVKALNPKWKRASQHLPGYSSCVKGDQWHWNGLQFTVHWPPKMVKRAYNPHSCVITVDDGHTQVLLTGDIDAISEMILARNKALMRAEIMLVPHHGSATSSKGLFVNQVKPKLALASLALDNQWGMPAVQVLDQYSLVASKWMDTGTHGQITVHFKNDVYQVSSARKHLSPRWYRQTVRNRVE